MKLSRSTHYALCAALEMAATPEEPMSVARVAGRDDIPEAALAKVFQQLVRSGLAVGTRGVGGGYRLTKPASRVTVLDVIRAFEAPERPVLPARARAGRVGRRLHELFGEVDELVRCTFESVTLETLARGPKLKAAVPPPRR